MTVMIAVVQVVTAVVDEVMTDDNFMYNVHDAYCVLNLLKLELNIVFKIIILI